MQLKDFQKYRYTLPLIAILFVLAIILAISTTGIQKPSPIAPSIKPPTALFSSFDPVTLSIPWEKISIGTSKNDIEKILGKPANTTTNVDQEIITYTSTTPQQFHTVEYKNGKAIKITRFVNERKEKITPEQYRSQYSKREVIQQGEGTVYQIESYQINKDEYIVIVLDTQHNTIYTIINATKEKYQEVKESLKKEADAEQIEHLDIDPY